MYIGTDSLRSCRWIYLDASGNNPQTYQRWRSINMVYSLWKQGPSKMSFPLWWRGIVSNLEVQFVFSLFQIFLYRGVQTHMLGFHFFTKSTFFTRHGWSFSWEMFGGELKAHLLMHVCVLVPLEFRIPPPSIHTCPPFYHGIMYWFLTCLLSHCVYDLCFLTFLV